MSVLTHAIVEQLDELKDRSTPSARFYIGRDVCSFFNVEKKLSATVLSRQLAIRLMLQRIRCEAKFRTGVVERRDPKLRSIQWKRKRTI
jgi:hypothetical protein